MRSSNAGFTLMEGVFSMLILSLAASASLQISGILSRQITFTSEKMDESKVVNDLILTIQNDPRRFMLNFNPTKSSGVDEQWLDSSDLPLGFGRGLITSASNCAKSSGQGTAACIGKFGLMIQPKSGYRGLLVAQVRIKLDSSGSLQDFIFLVPEI